MLPELSFESTRGVFPEEFAAWVRGRATWDANRYELLNGEVLGSSQGFELATGATVAPGASFVSAERWSAMAPPEPGMFLRVVPDLVVEILSLSTASHDRGEKKAIYEQSGVREYWLVDPRGKQVTVFVAQAGKFDLGTLRELSDEFESAVLSGLVVKVADLFP